MEGIADIFMKDGAEEQFTKSYVFEKSGIEIKIQ